MEGAEQDVAYTRTLEILLFSFRYTVRETQRVNSENASLKGNKKR